jgi:PilZ domain
MPRAKERRSEPRLLCSDMIRVRLPGRGRREISANLEDISASGACLLLEERLPLDAALVLLCGKSRFRGKVKYCVNHEIGYFVGVEFEDGQKWSRELYEPQHLLDVALLRQPGSGQR